MSMREARSRRQAGRLARLWNEAHGCFGRNPKGTGAVERHCAFVKRLDGRSMPLDRVSEHSVNSP